MKNTIQRWLYNRASGLQTVCSANYYYYHDKRYGNYYPIWKFYKYWYDILTKILNSKLLDYNYSESKFEKTSDYLKKYK